MILYATNPLESPNKSTGPPPNLAFLEIAAEFSKKLMKQDKKMVLALLVSYSSLFNVSLIIVLSLFYFST